MSVNENENVNVYIIDSWANFINNFNVVIGLLVFTSNCQTYQIYAIKPRKTGAKSANYCLPGCHCEGSSQSRR